MGVGEGGNFVFWVGGNYTTEMADKAASAETRKHGAHAIVRVRPRYAPEIAIAGGGEYCFAYAVEIENAGGVGVSLVGAAVDHHGRRRQGSRGCGTGGDWQAAADFAGGSSQV